MDFDAVVEAMSLHYDNDVDYKPVGNSDGMFRTNYKVTFELLNEPPQDPVAPFFPVASLDEAKAVFLSVESKMRKDDVHGFFDQILIQTPVDLEKPLYFTMYKVPRIDHSTSI